MALNYQISMEDVKKEEVLSEDSVQVDDTTEEVTEEISEDVSEETTEEDVKAGDKTPPNELLKSLQEEREKRRALAEELKQLKSSASFEEESSDKSDDSDIRAEVQRLKREREVERAISQNPSLNGKELEFQAYIDEDNNNGISIDRLAKLFIAEKNLNTPKRKGLEKATGGEKTGVKTGMTQEEVENLRKTNYKKYVEALREGKINIK